MPPPTNQPLTFLTLPPEIRNQVYAYIFVPPASNEPIPQAPDIASPLAKALQLDYILPCSSTHKQDDNSDSNSHAPNRLATLLTSRQIHHEASLLALSTTTFHLHSTSAEPEAFALKASPLSKPQLSALKHLTLTARISQLRALNESWNNVPFGNSSLSLETLVLVPRRPDATKSAWAEVAELDQCHTLAHVLAETCKGLRGVGEVRVVNTGCFGEAVWRVCYRHLVFKVWRWGGGNCGVRFEWGEGCSSSSSSSEDDGVEGEREGAGDGDGAVEDVGVSGEKEVGGCFRIFLGKDGDNRGIDAGDEAYKLLSAEGTSAGALFAAIGMP
jgi:hypothetical protein